MNSMKVLVLVHPDCVPPEKASKKDADWADWKTEHYVKSTLDQLGHQVLVLPLAEELGSLQEALQDFKPHIVFNLLEEFQGDPRFEAHVVSFLELSGVAYTGCNPHGLAIGRDKAVSKKILGFHSIQTPGFFTVPRNKKVKVPESLQYPMIVKSLNEEASLGISQDSIVFSEAKLKARVEFIHESLGTSALVEEYIEGREIYVGVLGNQNLKVFAPWELSFGTLAESSHPIATRTLKFNAEYCKKYGIKRGVAQGLNPWLQRKIENLSRDTYKALKLSGYARLDLRIKENQEIYFLEANPNPELANYECFANAAQHSAMTYPDLIGKILSLGLSYKKAA